VIASFRRAARRPLFLADWHDAAFLHFTIEPLLLRPLVPVELDLHRGVAYVTLVAFTQQNLRPAIGGRAAALLSTPLASHEFLNLRTYVRDGETRGIYFLAEWIPNRLAAFMGPRTYGLPYRLGKLSYRFDIAGGLFRGRVIAHGSLEFEGRFDPSQPWAAAEPGTQEEFLLERYRAFTYRKCRVRSFDVDHAPWPQQPLEVQLDELSLLASCGPWTRHLEFACAHVSPGVSDVAISAPRS
jgi:uncharacterized protein YqjF (DUF2071 family)